MKSDEMRIEHRIHSQRKFYHRDNKMRRMSEREREHEHEIHMLVYLYWMENPENQSYTMKRDVRYAFDPDNNNRHLNENQLLTNLLTLRFHEKTK